MIFSGLHFGLVVQLQPEGRARGSVDLRTNHASSGPRQRRRRPLGRQGPDEVHGDDAAGTCNQKMFYQTGYS